MSHFWRDFEKTQPFEKAFINIYNQNHQKASKLIHINEKFDADFLIKNNKAELKCDFTKHSNFFFEKIKNVRKNKYGGPWQSLYEYDCKWFIYWFVSSKNINQWNCYVFDNKNLIEWLDENYDKFKEFKINNQEYDSIGISVPVDQMPRDLFKIKKMVKEN